MTDSWERLTTFELLSRHGVSRRDFLRFCTLTTAALGLESTFVPKVVRALETQPRLPVIWLHGQGSNCSTESFLRSASPAVEEVLFNLISLDYHAFLQVAAGHQALAARRSVMEAHSGQYVLAVEGSVPTGAGGAYCTTGGQSFEQVVRETAKHAKAVIAWGSCAGNGCVQAARPDPTGAEPVSRFVGDRPFIQVPGCPPIPEVMTGVIVHLQLSDRLPEQDAFGRPRSYYGRRVHDDCERRPHFDAGRFVERWDDEGAQQGWCLYKMGCRGPTTYNSCATMRWNDGTSFPIGSGHGCIGCSENSFWDNGPFYRRQSTVPMGDTTATPDQVGKFLATATGAALTAHVASTVAARIARGRTGDADPTEQTDD